MAMAEPAQPTQGPAPDENRFLLVITAEAEVVKADECSDDAAGSDGAGDR